MRIENLDVEGFVVTKKEGHVNLSDITDCLTVD